MKLFIIAFFTIMVIGASVVYNAKLHVDSLHDELASLKRQVAQAEQEEAVLRAEWAFVSRPERVLDLSRSLLSMSPLPAERIVSLDAIPLRRTARDAEQQSENTGGQR